MRNFYLLVTITCLLLNINTLYAQTIWTGPITEFTRVDGEGVNWSLEVNQDRITDIVWITRASNKGIFNIYSETLYVDFVSPADTEWAFGTTANIGIPFDSWENTVAPRPPDMVGKDMVLHLITDEIYIDIKFLSWAEGKAGGFGGFSYQRSTDQSLGINDFERNQVLNIYPNPSNSFVEITGITSTQKFKVHNILGVKVLEQTIESNSKIDIKNLVKGIYFIHFENGKTLKFIKN